MFTQRHYTAIAQWLKDTKPHQEEYDALKRWNIIVETFVSKFSQDNPNFKADLFRRAAAYNN